jgi:serine protease
MLASCGGGGSGGSSDTPLQNTLPVPRFVVEPATAQIDVEMAFDATASFDEDGNISQYLWAFGDGSSAEGSRVVHTYDIAGDKIVTLTVVDNQGGRATVESSVTVLRGFSLAGEIKIASNIVTDSDVNDPTAPYRSNDSADRAQALPNPVISNGFISSDGTGVDRDRFADRGDIFDFYRIELLAGQLISLQLADFEKDNPSAHDIDLFLFDQNNQLLAFSDADNSEFENIVAPQSGTAYIMLRADSGATKYILRVSNDFTAGRIASENASIDFFPNQLMLGYRSNQFLAQSLGVDTPGLLAEQATLRSVGSKNMKLAQLSSARHCRELLEKLSGAGMAHQDEPMTMAAQTATSQPQDNVKYLTLALIKALRKRSDVAFAEPNYRISASAFPNDFYFRLQWHYPFINLPDAWNITTGTAASGQVVVAVLDSGVLLGHPDLANKTVAGYDFIRDPLVAADGDGIDPNPDDVGDREGASGQSSFHGTHVAGTIAALSNNSNGVAGVSWGAQIMPIRVLGVGGGSGYDLVQGIRYAAGLANDSGRTPARRADVINLSLGCLACYSQSLADTITEARRAGVIVVAAAGNNASSTRFYPAAYEGVVAVSAVNSASKLASYSNFGSYIDVTAPGGDDIDRDADGYPDRILSLLGDDSSGNIEFRYGWSSGTSMAAPHVAGVAALMKAVYPALSPADFDLAIANGTAVTDLGVPGRDDDFGFGKINALKAVQAAQALGGGNQPGVITANPTVLDFAAGESLKILQLNAQGDVPPEIVSVTGDQVWIDVAPGNNVAADGTGDYIVQVDPGDLDTAVYDGKIIVQLENNSKLELPIYMQVLKQAAGVGNPGLLYVLLRDASSQVTSLQTTASLDGEGRFRYRFDKVVKVGTYRIFAGSDIDNDFVICGAGETCGAWPTRDRPEEILIDRDMSGLDLDLVTEANFGVEGQLQEAADKIQRGP